MTDVPPIRQTSLTSRPARPGCCSPDLCAGARAPQWAFRSNAFSQRRCAWSYALVPGLLTYVPRMTAIGHPSAWSAARNAPPVPDDANSLDDLALREPACSPPDLIPGHCSPIPPPVLLSSSAWFSSALRSSSSLALPNRVRTYPPPARAPIILVPVPIAAAPCRVVNTPPKEWPHFFTLCFSATVFWACFVPSPPQSSRPPHCSNSSSSVARRPTLLCPRTISHIHNTHALHEDRVDMKDFCCASPLLPIRCE